MKSLSEIEVLAISLSKDDEDLEYASDLSDEGESITLKLYEYQVVAYVKNIAGGIVGIKIYPTDIGFVEANK